MSHSTHLGLPTLCTMERHPYTLQGPPITSQRFIHTNLTMSFIHTSENTNYKSQIILSTQNKSCLEHHEEPSLHIEEKCPDTPLSVLPEHLRYSFHSPQGILPSHFSVFSLTISERSYYSFRRAHSIQLR